MNTFQTMGRAQARPEVLGAFMRGVYGWMSAGLLLTAGVAFFTARSEAILSVLFSNQIIMFAVMLAPLGFVLALSAGIQRMKASTATGLFLAYSAVNGLALSPILLIYAQADIFKAFVSAAGMFAAMSIYGLTTKKDLTSWGSFLFMGLIGIIIASVVNIFMASPMMDFVISAVGVLVFTGLTAYDTQRLSDMGMNMPSDGEAVRKGSILGALTLYLDFINLFLMLLRLFGGSRD